MAEFLIYVIVKTLGIGLVVTVVGFALNKAAATLRRSYWIAAALSLAILPLMQLSIPKLEIGVPEQATEAFRTGLRRLEKQEFKPTPAPTQVTSESPINVPQSEPWTLVEMILCIYLLVSGALVVRLIIGLFQVKRSIYAAEVDRTEFADYANRLATELKVSRQVNIRFSNAAQTPFTAGLMQPSIVLPEDARTWSSEKLKAALIHELAHIKRCDWALQLLIGFISAMSWANPFVWLAARRFKLAAEQAADDSVLETGIKSTEYADYLMSVARCMRLPSAVALPMARKQDMGNRLESILSNRSRHASGYRLRFFGLLVPALALPIAAFAADFGTAGSTQTGYKQKVTGGGTVELLGISSLANQGPESWSSLGQKLATNFHKWGPGNTSGHDFEFTLSIKGVRDPSPVYEFAREGAVNSISPLTHDRDDMWVAFDSKAPNAADSIDLRVGVLTGAWESLFATKPEEFGNKGSSSANWEDGDLIGREDIVAAQMDAGNDIILTISYFSKNRAVRVIGVYGTPTARVEKYADDLGRNVLQTLGQNNYRLAKEGLVEIRVQTRKYEWLTFRNVQLKAKA